jgi:hypothetical protein
MANRIVRGPRISTIPAAAAVLLLLSAPVFAQWLRYPTAGVPRTRDGKPDLTAAAPRGADGKPDFSGVWENEGYTNVVEGVGGPPKTVFFDLAHGMKDDPPYQPWAADLAKKRKAEFSRENPDARCLPLGALQMLAHPLPKKIVHGPGLLVILHERNMEFRQIFTDGRALPADQQPSWNGYSSGKWEGDTLIVQTTGFRDGLWADFNGSPLTDAARITERFRRPSYGVLAVDVTVDDPKAYTRPWTVAVNQRIALDTDLLEYSCLENEKDVPHLVGK